jgi:hypothetical protein
MAQATAACRSTHVLSTRAVTATERVAQPWVMICPHVLFLLLLNHKNNKKAHIASTAKTLARRVRRDFEPSRCRSSFTGVADVSPRITWFLGCVESTASIDECKLYWVSGQAPQEFDLLTNLPTHMCADHDWMPFSSQARVRRTRKMRLWRLWR